MFAAGAYAACSTPLLSLLGGCAGSPQHVRWPLEPGKKLEGATAGRNLAICILDAARSDHLGCYGYPRETTPNIDRLAEESLVFQNHFCQVSYTKASTASLFTAQYPDAHLADFKRDLEESAFTMARGLEDAGYETVLLSSNPFASPTTGACHPFQQNFGTSEAAGVVRGSETRRSPEPLLRLFESWLEQRGTSPFVAYIHLLPPHKPYAAPDDIDALFRGKEPPDWDDARYHPKQYSFPIRRTKNHADNPALMPPDVPVQDWINLYDANLRYGDWAVGQVIRMLRDAGAFDDTIFVMTSDHGEAFGEHGFVLHAPAIHDELAKIPLLIRLPDASRTGSIAGLTQSIDLLPTLLQLLAVPYPGESIQGRSLLPLLAGEAEAVNDYSFTRAVFDGGKYMVRDRRHSLLLFGNGRWKALYDSTADPRQLVNVIGEKPASEEELVEAFRVFAEGQRHGVMHFLDPSFPKKPAPPLPSARASDMSEDVKDDLRELGYLK
jgi:arylsulfatase